LKNPECEAAFLLKIPTRCSEHLKALHFGFEVVGFYVEVHTLFSDFLVRRSLYQNPDIRVRKAETAINVAALLGKGFFGGAKRRGPK